MEISFQLYSARQFTPWADVFARLAELGYDRVEGFGGVYDDVAATRALLSDNGLAMPSGHVDLALLEDDPGAVLALARALGLSQVYVPYLAAEARPADAAGWRALGARLAAAGAPLREAGLTFGWHNHDFEFQPLPTGAYPIALMLDAAPDLAWEADIAWILRGGADPLPWIARYGRRIKAAHVKDIAPDGENADEDGWADLGDGVVDWPAILAALRAAGTELFVIEHDNPSDLARFAARSLAYVWSL